MMEEKDECPLPLLAVTDLIGSFFPGEILMLNSLCVLNAEQEDEA